MQTWFLAHLKGPLIISVHGLRTLTFSLLFFVIHSNFKKLPEYWFLTFFLLLSLSPSPTPPQNAKKFSHPTFVAMHVCVNSGLYFPSLMHVWFDPAPAVCAGCCMMNSFTRNMLRVRADPLRSDFSGATWIHGAKPLLSRLCVTQLFCLRRHRLAALLCILL